jgi:PBSX family phage portal protein
MLKLDLKAAKDRISSEKPDVKAAIFGMDQETDFTHTKFKDSKQSKDLFGSVEGKYITPPYDPYLLLNNLTMSTRLSQCVSIMVRNTVANGWSIETLKEVDDTNVPKPLEEEIETQKKQVNSLLAKPNELHSFTTLMSLIGFDEEVTGNAYMEVSRNAYGDISSLHWAPSCTIRVTTDHYCGFVQIRKTGTTPVFFKRFGDKRQINRNTGKEFTTDELAKLSPEEIEDATASEIIHFKLLTPINEIYGVPRYIPATPSIVGVRLVHERNISLFNNEAVPKFAVLVEGGTLGKASRRSLERFWNAKTKGPSKVGRTIVLQAEVKKTHINKDNSAKIRLVPLTVGVTEDSNFQGYIKQSNEEVREAFGISKVFFTLDDVNRASGDIGRQITNEQVFEPEAHRHEHLLLITIVNELIGTNFVVPLPKCRELGYEILKEREAAIKGVYGGFVNLKNNDDNAFSAFISKMQDGGLCEFVDKETDGLEFRTRPIIKIQFDRSTTQDLVNQATVDEKLAKWGALTPNDIRVRFGLKPFPDDEEHVWAKLPLPVVTVLANRGWDLGLDLGSGENEAETQVPEKDEEEQANNDDPNSGDTETETEEGEEEKVLDIDGFIAEIVGEGGIGAIKSGLNGNS